MAKEINYQALRSELDTILAQLQTNELDVDEAITLYERGVAIAKDLESYLKTTQNKIMQLKKRFDT